MERGYQPCSLGVATANKRVRAATQEGLKIIRAAALPEAMENMKMPDWEKFEKSTDKLGGNTPQWPNLLELHEPVERAMAKAQPRKPQEFSKSEPELEDHVNTTGALRSTGILPNVSLSTSDLLLASSKQNPAAVIMPLNDYLLSREQHDKEQSYYKLSTTFLYRLSRRVIGADDASSKFDQALRNGDSQGMTQWQDADRKQRQLEQNLGTYSAAILKTGLLFCGPKTAYVGLMGISAADQANPSDSIGKQAVDALLGSAKGAASRYTFDKLNSTSLNPATKGWLFGLSDRFLDVGLTSNTYLTRTGDFTPDSLKAGLRRTGESVFGLDALKTDAGTLVVSHAVMLPIGYARGGAFFNNPLYAKATMSGVSGLTNGSLIELNRQQDIGKQFPIDWWEVSKKGLEKAAVNTVSALPPSRILQALEKNK